MTTSGLKMGEYRPDDTDDEVEIRARFPKEDRTLDRLGDIRINSSAGSVPISNFVERNAEQKTGKVNRVDGFRVMAVKADVLPGVNVDAKLGEIREFLKTLNLDPSIKIAFKGEDEEQRQALHDSCLLLFGGGGDLRLYKPHVLHRGILAAP